MDSLLDLLYRIDAIEGVALCDHSGKLEENHLSLVDDTVKKIAVSVASARVELMSSSRTPKGFLFKTASQAFLIFFQQDIIIVQIASGFSYDELHSKVSSVIGSQIGKPKKRQLPVTVTPDLPSEEEFVESGLEYAAFRSKLLSLLTRVAPANVAQKILAESESTFDTQSGSIVIDKAREMGETCFSHIPNKKRREMITKEFYQILSSFDQ